MAHPVFSSRIIMPIWPGVWPGRLTSRMSLVRSIVSPETVVGFWSFKREVDLGEEVLGVLLHALHVVVLVLVHHDVDVGVLEDAQPAGVVRVEVAHHDPPEVLGSEPQFLQAVLEADLGRHRRQVDEVLPDGEPLVGGPRRHARLPEDATVRVLDDVGDRRALVRPVLILGLLDQHRPIQAHVAEVHTLQADCHGSPYLNAGMMCSAKSSIWRRASSIGIRP